MGRKTTRGRRRQQEANRPSTFFLVALAIGLIVLVVMAVVLINRPAVKEPLKNGAVPTAAIARLV